MAAIVRDGSRIIARKARSYNDKSHVAVGAALSRDGSRIIARKARSYNDTNGRSGS